MGKPDQTLQTSEDPASGQGRRAADNGYGSRKAVAANQAIHPAYPESERTRELLGLAAEAAWECLILSG